MARLFEDDMSGVLGPNPENAISSPVPSQSGGIGIAKEDPFKAEYAKMSGPQEFFSRLGEFGAGVTGRPSPMQAQIDSRRKDKMLQMEETKGLLADLENLTKITEGMDDAAKSGLIDTVAKKWEAVQPGYGDAVKTVGARPTLLKGFEQYLPHLPAPMQQLAKRDPRAFLKLVGTKEGAKMLNDAADQPALRLAGRRRDAVIVGWQQLVPKELADKLNADGVLTDAEVMEIQDKLPEKLRFTDEEKDAIKRNPLFWEGSGVLHGDKAQEVLADRAKKAGKPDAPLSDLGKLKDDLKNKRITQAEYDAKLKKLTHVPADKSGAPSESDIVNREFKLSDDYRADTKKFSDLRSQFESATGYMAERAEGKTSAGDAALLFTYAKMRDPTDRLAVSETRDLVKLGNIFERFGVSITGILDKGETLPDRVARDMYAEIRRRFTDLNSAQSKVEKEYRTKAKDYGGNPDRVVRPLALSDKTLKGGKDEPKGQDFKDPGEVRTAFQAGKISREQAKKALKKFGFN